MRHPTGKNTSSIGDCHVESCIKVGSRVISLPFKLSNSMPLLFIDDDLADTFRLSRSSPAKPPAPVKC